MAGTFTNLYYHFIFSTKNREPFINSHIEKRLYEYIGGIVKKEDGVLYEIGGMPDHLHMLIKHHQKQTLADLMRTIKSRSSGWIRKEFDDCSYFKWQDGYGVFSVSESKVASVRKYIQEQKTHHKKENFKGEYVRFLKANDIEYDERYLWD